MGDGVVSVAGAFGVKTTLHKQSAAFPSGMYTHTMPCWSHDAIRCAWQSLGCVPYYSNTQCSCTLQLICQNMHLQYRCAPGVANVNSIWIDFLHVSMYEHALLLVVT